MDRLPGYVLWCCMSVLALAGQALASPLSDAERAYSKGNYAQAAKLYLQLAKQGNGTAQLGLGKIYFFGQGVRQDYKAAGRWLTLAAKQGIAAAQNLVGATYDSGLGVEQSYETAAKWYRLSAEQGDADGQYNLGIMFARELGVPQDYLMAYMWMSLSGKNPNELFFVAKRMSDEQIAKAQFLAGKCAGNKFKGCY